jgi:hypothetical protein
MDSMLVVFYSYTGNSRRVAETLAAQHGWLLGEITDAERRGVLRCVLDSLLRRRPAIRYTGPDPSDFRTVVLVSPIWAQRLAGPMRSFVAGRREDLRRVAVISTMGSGGEAKAVAEITQLLGRAPILTAAFTEREIADGSCNGRLLRFGEQLVPGGAAQRQKPHPSVWQPRQARPVP